MKIVWVILGVVVGIAILCILFINNVLNQLGGH